MSRGFLSNILFVLLLNGLVKPIYLFWTERTVQLRVGTEAFGEYAALLGWGLILSILCDLGLTNYNTRSIAQAPESLSREMSTLLVAKGGLSLGFAVLLLTGGYALGYDAAQLRILGHIALNLVLLSFYLYFRSNVAALHHYRADGIASITDKLLLIVACSYLFWSVPEGGFLIQHFLWAKTITLSLSAAGVLLYTLSVTDIRWVRVEWARVGRTIRKGLPFALLILLMYIYTYSDIVMLERLHPRGDYEAGAYYAAYRLLNALVMFGLLFTGILLPLFSRMLASRHRSEVSELAEHSFRLVFSVAIGAGVVGTFYAHDIMLALDPNATPYWSGILTGLLWSFPCIVVIHIYGTLLTAGNHLRALNAIAMSSVILNLLLNFYLIPRYGAHGAVYATVATQLMTALLQLVVVQRTLRAAPPWQLWLSALAYGVGLAILFYALAGVEWAFYLKLLPAAVLAIPIAWATRLLSRHSLEVMLAAGRERLQK